MGYRSDRCRHSHRHLRTFKCRSDRRGTAVNLLFVSDRHLSVRSNIQKKHFLFGVLLHHCQKIRSNISSDKSCNRRCYVYRSAIRKSQLLSGILFSKEFLRHKRRHPDGNRRNSRKQMTHYRISHHGKTMNLFPSPCFFLQCPKHLCDLKNNLFF